MVASVFFTDSVTVAGLKQKYSDAILGRGKVRIVIVPGHDDESWGTDNNGVKEADMTVVLGEELYKLLQDDPEYEPILVRDKSGYREPFKSFFVAEQASIKSFVANKKQIMRDLMAAGMVHRSDGVVHNNAPLPVVWRLYGINKWANENKADIVIHIHFNDYPGRRRSKTGQYAGFSIYVPEGQFSNARASRAFATPLFEQFSKFYPASNLPKEDDGIVSDQELIALGAYNTLDAASALIEYGYIYEQAFLDAEVRDTFLRELALQTYIGINRFFGNTREIFRRYPTSLLPFEWSSPLKEGDRSHPSILSLQAALLYENLYPPEGVDKHTCPLTGSFGPCTALAVKGFQQKYGIIPPTGVVGEVTLGKLNELYGR